MDEHLKQRGLELSAGVEVAQMEGVRCVQRPCLAQKSSLRCSTSGLVETVSSRIPNLGRLVSCEVAL
jgi:hypothetical protein